MKKVLITGGCGFIGSNLSDYLRRKGFKVYLIDNFSNNKTDIPIKKSLLYKRDINKINQIKNLKNISAIIHLAASADILISKKNENKYYKDNISGLQEVLRFCSEKNVKKVVFASSASVYGDTKNKKVNENFSLKPSHYYGYTKLIGEKMVETYSKINNINYTILRFFNIYGPKSNAVLSTFLAQKVQNKIITIFGNGEQRRDFLHVDDLCGAIWKVLVNKKSNKKTYNLGSGKSISINELVKKISYSKTKNLMKRNDDIEISIAQISKAKKELNWKPKIEIDKGIKKTLTLDFKRLKKVKLISLKEQINLIKKFNT